MDDFKESQIDFEALKKVQLSDIFPKDIKYPGQRIDQPKQETQIHSSDFKLKASPPVKIQFHHDKPPVWDVVVIDKMIVCCGGRFVKVYSKENIMLNKSKEPIHTFEVLIHKENSKELYKEDFYTLAHTEVVFNKRRLKYLAAGGLGSIIRLLDLTNLKEQGKLIGHRNEIYELRFHPLEGDLLFSASKDYSIRLWNIVTGIQICIFGGPEGHSAEVLTIDIHLSGEYFISGGIDSFVKIWEIDESVKTKIKSSRTTPKNNFTTLIKANSMFSCNSIHENYVDCVRFNGNLVLSKSVDGVIKEWLPSFNKDDDNHFLLNKYVYPLSQQLWFLKFSVDYDFSLMGVGNNLGDVILFKINDDKAVENYNIEKSIFLKIQSNKDTLIRQVAFHQDLEYIAWVTDDSSLYVCDITKCR